MKLTTEQLNNIMDGHIWRVVDNMDMKTLCQFAYDSIRASFLDENLSVHENTQKELLEDIFTYEGGDGDSVHEFLVGTGEVTNDEAEAVVDDYLDD